MTDLRFTNIPTSPLNATADKTDSEILRTGMAKGESQAGTEKRTFPMKIQRVLDPKLFLFFSVTKGGLCKIYVLAANLAITLDLFLPAKGKREPR